MQTTSYTVNVAENDQPEGATPSYRHYLNIEVSRNGHIAATIEQAFEVLNGLKAVYPAPMYSLRMTETVLTTNTRPVA